MAMPFFHVWFATKNRKWLLQGDVGTRSKELLAAVAMEKGIGLIECETMIDHVHLLLDLKLEDDLPTAMRLLKGRVSYEISKEFPGWQFDGGVATLWQRGYGSRLVPASQVATVRRYIQTQDERVEKYVR